MAVAGSVGFGPRAGSLRGGGIGPGARIPWRHLASDSIRRGDVSRLVGVTKPFPRWGWRFWHRNSAIWARYRGVIPFDDREIVLSEPESRENPQVCDCVEPSALQRSFGLEYRDIGPTGMNVVVVK